MKIKKFLSNLAIGISFGIISSTSFARPDVNQFLSDYDNLLSIMLKSYHEEVKEPLSAKIFDISQPLYYSFLSNSTHRQYSKEFLAMMFYNDFQINNQPTNFCFILYDGKKLGQLDTYLNNTFPKSEDAIYYLTAHELGHCLAAHQRVLGHIPAEPDEYKEEQIADMFAMGFFLSRHQDEQAKRIIHLVNEVPKTDIHYNGNALQFFYDHYTQDNPSIKNIYQLFNTTYRYFKQYNHYQ